MERLPAIAAVVWVAAVELGDGLSSLRQFLGQQKQRLLVQREQRKQPMPQPETTGLLVRLEFTSVLAAAAAVVFQVRVVELAVLRLPDTKLAVRADPIIQTVALGLRRLPRLTGLLLVAVEVVDCRLVESRVMGLLVLSLAEILTDQHSRPERLEQLVRGKLAETQAGLRRMSRMAEAVVVVGHQTLQQRQATAVSVGIMAAVAAAVVRAIQRFCLETVALVRMELSWQQLLVDLR